ncbi:MAG: hypothetical protein IPL86_17470 [Flavobacteriales bacterium]|nr:hypothetical protein [Flavobacteriales bacterium]
MNWPQGPNVQVDYDTPATMPFTFFGPCIDIAQGITTPLGKWTDRTQSEGQLRLQRADGLAIGLVQVSIRRAARFMQHAMPNANARSRPANGRGWHLILRATNGTKTETVPCVRADR